MAAKGKNEWLDLPERILIRNLVEEHEIISQCP